MIRHLRKPWLHWLALGWLSMAALAVAQESNDTEKAADKDGSEAPDPAAKERFAFSGEDWAERLAEQMPQQVQWLEAPSQRFLALVRPDQSGNRQGGALIIAEPGTSPATGWAESIRQVLPKGGWYSLAIPLASEAGSKLPPRVLPAKGTPPKTGGEQSKATPAASQSASSSGDVAIDVATGRTDLSGEAYEQYVFERLEAGLTHLREQGYQNLVLIGVGRGAEWASRYLSANGSRFGPRGLGLVWVAPQFSMGADQLFDEILGKDFARPLLDLTPAMDPGREPRKAAARRNQMRQYVQDRITSARPPSPTGARGVAQRIKGWLSENMRGMQARQSQ